MNAQLGSLPLSIDRASPMTGAIHQESQANYQSEQLHSQSHLRQSGSSSNSLNGNSGHHFQSAYNYNNQSQQLHQHYSEQVSDLVLFIFLFKIHIVAIFENINNFDLFSID